MRIDKELSFVHKSEDLIDENLFFRVASCGEFFVAASEEVGFEEGVIHLLEESHGSIDLLDDVSAIGIFVDHGLYFACHSLDFFEIGVECALCVGMGVDHISDSYEGATASR